MDRTDRKEEIFRAIWQILDEKDIDSLTIREIAQRCNLHANTVGYYFTSKDDMLLKFHTHIMGLDDAGRPDYFHDIPAGMHPALAVAGIVDYTIFHSDRISPARFKLNRYLIPRMKDNESIKRHIVDNQDLMFCNYREILMKYAAAGYVIEESVDDAICDLFIVSEGYGIQTYFSYDSRYLDKTMSYQSLRIKENLLKPEYHHLIERNIGK